MEQLFNAILLCDRLVEHEYELGRAAQPEPLAYLPTHEGRGARQSLAAVRPRSAIAQGAVVDPRVLQIGADLHAGDGDEAQARVVQIARDHTGDLGTNLVGDSVGTCTLAHLEVPSFQFPVSSCQLSQELYFSPRN